MGRRISGVSCGKLAAGDWRNVRTTTPTNRRPFRRIVPMAPNYTNGISHKKAQKPQKFFVKSCAFLWLIIIVMLARDALPWAVRP